MSSEGTLLQAFATRLAALTLASGGKVFAKIFEAIDKVSPESFYALPCAVLKTGSATWDDENPELGTTKLYVDVYTLDISTPGVSQQLIGERGLNDIREIMRRDVPHFAGGLFWSAVSLTDESESIAGEIDRGGIWHMRMEFAVLRG